MRWIPHYKKMDPYRCRSCLSSAVVVVLVVVVVAVAVLPLFY